MSETIEEIAPEITPTQEREPLNAVDRCDRCGAQAYVAVVTKESAEDVANPGELLFCGHHAAKYEDKLREFVVRDEREKLDIKTDAAAY